MQRLIWLPRLAAGNGTKMLCRCPDQIHPVVFGDPAVYQFSRSHLWVRKKGRNLYKKPFAFQSENWYVFSPVLAEKRPVHSTFSAAVRRGRSLPVSASGIKRVPVWENHVKIFRCNRWYRWQSLRPRHEHDVLTNDHQRSQRYQRLLPASRNERFSISVSSNGFVPT